MSQETIPLRELNLIITGTEKATAGDDTDAEKEQNTFFRYHARLASAPDLEAFSTGCETWSFATALPIDLPPSMTRVGCLGRKEGCTVASVLISTTEPPGARILCGHMVHGVFQAPEMRLFRGW